ncbi:MAG: RsmB/NOP family class I SAM-dependent RNA methyltransferase [Chlorobi bacterium]|nr:RsmB/NOP family class I SAM-dependent RNA methyltransferase [Chlorobiota bacterium]
MNPHSLLNHCIQLLDVIERAASTPADELASAYMRSRKYLGAKERRAVSEIVFSTLRMKNTAEFIVNTMLRRNARPEPQPTLAALVGTMTAVAPLWAGFDPRSVLDDAANMPTDPIAVAEHLYREVTGDTLPPRWHSELVSLLHELDEGGSDEFGSLALVACLPEWIVAHLHDGGMTTDEIRQLGRAMIVAAPVVLRVATPALSRQQIIALLEQSGIRSQPSTLVPDGIVLDHRARLYQHELYRSGAVEVQDAGSQLVSLALAPEEHWRILDACAGAGGKTLHLAYLQRDRGEIVASDVEPRRLGFLQRRLQRHRFRSIRTEPIPLLPLPRQKAYEKRFDAVLLDVPCSGTGTLRRSPEIRWRLRPRQIEHIVATQERILDTYSRYVRPGGILVYATCSILHGENERVVERFLDRSTDFVPDPLAPAFERYGVGLNIGEEQWSLRLAPHTHGTDGFFIARLRRR